MSPLQSLSGGGQTDLILTLCLGRYLIILLLAISQPNRATADFRAASL